ncbi:hypothetical protein LSAT2_018458 [Lamellibrachia satsuma]|nr:hypothetical protein LSAT2_018458 [Lamellibrachia satsuma]
MKIAASFDSLRAVSDKPYHVTHSSIWLQIMALFDPDDGNRGRRSSSIYRMKYSVLYLCMMLLFVDSNTHSVYGQPLHKTQTHTVSMANLSTQLKHTQCLWPTSPQETATITSR